METEKRWFAASVSSAAKDTQQQPSFRVIVFVFAFQSIFWTSAASRMSASLSGIVSEKMSQARMRRSRAYNYRRGGRVIASAWILSWIYPSCNKASIRSEEHTSELQSHHDLV